MTNAKRQKASRARGKAIAVTLIDPEAIEILERQAALLGSQRAALEAGLRALEKKKGAGAPKGLHP